MCFAVIEDDIETVNILSFFLSFKLSPGFHRLQSMKLHCRQKCLLTFTACFRKLSEKFPKKRDQHCLWEVGVSAGNGCGFFFSPMSDHLEYIQMFCDEFLFDFGETVTDPEIKG